MGDSVPCLNQTTSFCGSSRPFSRTLRIFATEERFAQVFEKLREHDEKFAALHSIMTFHMGVTFQHQYQLEHIDAEIKALKSAASPP